MPRSFGFPEALEFRDRLARETGVELVVRTVQDSIDRGRCVEWTGPGASRNALQSVTLLDAIAELRMDAALGGARRAAAGPHALDAAAGRGTLRGAPRPLPDRGRRHLHRRHGIGRLVRGRGAGRAGPPATERNASHGATERTPCLSSVAQSVEVPSARLRLHARPTSREPRVLDSAGAGRRLPRTASSLLHCT